jgi:8-amino-7-oxononanoate synthase
LRRKSSHPAKAPFMNHEQWIEEILGAARVQGLERHLRAFPNVGGRVEVDGRSLLNFASNDYLGLATHPHVVEASQKALLSHGAGAAASRLVSGTLSLHEDLETRLAEFKGYPSALTFGSGYMTNLGVLSALAPDHVFADRLAHASLIDGIVLSRARLHRFRHNDVEHLERLLSKYPSERSVIVVESVYSMDGDIAPLVELAELAQRFGLTLMVDEAHSTGIMGEQGRGLVSQLGLEDKVHVSMGTMSKALGGYGGFIACSARIRNLCVNRARAFIYTTAMPPSVAGAALGALDVLRDEPELGTTLLKRCARFREALRALGFDTMQTETQIVPVVVGGNEAALDMARAMAAEGILVAAIRPPTVPAGMARLRFSVTLTHSNEDLDRTVDVLANVGRKHGLI